jgi:NAD(P)-dependent dehydrogenase (short-subunit alcohol dehydrogenase family)
MLTEMPAEVLADPRAADQLLRKVPLHRVGDPAEVAPAVVFLASAASSYMTGAVMTIDGGYSAR